MKKSKFELTKESQNLMDNYQDRKMIKWQPFAALRGHAASVRATANNRLKTKMPTLSSEQINNISNELKKIAEVQNSFAKGTFDINLLEKKLFKVFQNSLIDIFITNDYKINTEKQTIMVNSKSFTYDCIIEIISI